MEYVAACLVGALIGGLIGALLIPLLPFNGCWTRERYSDFWHRAFEGWLF